MFSMKFDWPKVGPQTQTQTEKWAPDAARGRLGQKGGGKGGSQILTSSKVWKKGTEVRRNDLHARPEGSADLIIPSSNSGEKVSVL